MTELLLAVLAEALGAALLALIVTAARRVLAARPRAASHAAVS